MTHNSSDSAPKIKNPGLRFIGGLKFNRMASRLLCLDADVKCAGQYTSRIKLKVDDMKKVIVKQLPRGSSKAALKPRLESKAIQHELMAPHEWKSMLNSVENQTVPISESRAQTPPNAEVPHADDALWERLSSTRWIKAQTENNTVL